MLIGAWNIENRVLIYFSLHQTDAAVSPLSI